MWRRYSSSYPCFDKQCNHWSCRTSGLAQYVSWRAVKYICDHRYPRGCQFPPILQRDRPLKRQRQRGCSEKECLAKKNRLIIVSGNKPHDALGYWCSLRKKVVYEVFHFNKPFTACNFWQSIKTHMSTNYPRTTISCRVQIIEIWLMGSYPDRYSHRRYGICVSFGSSLSMTIIQGNHGGDSHTLFIVVSYGG